MNGTRGPHSPDTVMMPSVGGPVCCCLLLFVSAHEHLVERDRGRIKGLPCPIAMDGWPLNKGGRLALHSTYRDVTLPGLAMLRDRGMYRQRYSQRYRQSTMNKILGKGKSEKRKEKQEGSYGHGGTPDPAIWHEICMYLCSFHLVLFHSSHPSHLISLHLCIYPSHSVDTPAPRLQLPMIGMEASSLFIVIVHLY